MWHYMNCLQLHITDRGTKPDTGLLVVTRFIGIRIGTSDMPFHETWYEYHAM
jgi:hypothetical protein